MSKRIGFGTIHEGKPVQINFTEDIVRNSRILIAGLILLSFQTFSADHQKDSFYIIFDASNSMWGELPDKTRKIEAARNAFSSLDPDWFRGRDMALRLYGHRRAKDCTDTEYVVPFAPSDSVLQKIAEQVVAVRPTGKTPITSSLQATLVDFQDRKGDILLISDGIETCGADPCELVKAWRQDQIGISVHVIGLGLKKKAEVAMQCIADASGTQYLQASSDAELVEAIKQAFSNDANKVNHKRGYRFSGVDKNGAFVPLKGSVTNAQGEVVPILGFHRYLLREGEYELNAGVLTLSGEVFNPVTRKLVVKREGEHETQIHLQRPASVITQFFKGGVEITGVEVQVHHSGVPVFTLRPNEESFLMPGNYKFTAKFSEQELQSTDIVSLKAGQEKKLLFESP